MLVLVNRYYVDGVENDVVGVLCWVLVGVVDECFGWDFFVLSLFGLCYFEW